jgi:hypothetical protein
MGPAQWHSEASDPPPAAHQLSCGGHRFSGMIVFPTFAASILYRRVRRLTVGSGSKTKHRQYRAQGGLSWSFLTVAPSWL